MQIQERTTFSKVCSQNKMKKKLVLKLLWRRRLVNWSAAVVSLPVCSSLVKHLSAK